MKLNQINALMTGRKSEVEKYAGELYKTLQHPSLFAGRIKVYEADDEDHGEKLPPDNQLIQKKAKDLLNDVTNKWKELWDFAFTQDTANQTAKANIVIDGQTVLKDVPVTTMLFLEKQVNDLESFITKLPTPDPAEEWIDDTAATGCLRAKEPKITIRTIKKPSHYVKAPATDKHPAQVEFFFVDERVGKWTLSQQSSCIKSSEKSELLSRVKKLKEALKLAREQANMLDVTMKSAGEPIFDYLLKGITR